MSEQIRVLRVIARMNVGGPSHHVTLVSQGLNALGYDHTLVAGVCEGREADVSAMAEDAAVRLVRVPTLSRRVHPVRDLRAFATLVDLARRYRPVIVHTHTAKAGVLGRLAARVAGAPIIVHTFHGHVFEGYFSPLMSRVVIEAEQRLAILADRIVAASAAVADDIVGHGIAPASKVRVIPPGLDLRALLTAEGDAPQQRAAWGAATGAPVVALVARLAPVKQAEIFVRLAERLAPRFPTARFILVGDGDCRPALEAQARASSAAASIVFAGFQSDLPRVYRAADVVVLCSLNEGLPVALIEAHAAARAVVAFGVGGVSEVVRDGVSGIVVQAQREDALAAGVESLLTDPARRVRYGVAGREWVRTAFSSERLVRDMDALYRELLAERGPS